MEYATLPEMNVWADSIMQRKPDFVIGDDYLRRWWVMPRNAVSNVYLHEIRHSDDDRALHDHPWRNASWLLRGRYIEHTPEGSFEREAGEYIERRAEALHRLELYPGETAVSLFFTGEKTRDWGFDCPNGWRPWQEFLAPDPSQVGRGCE